MAATPPHARIPVDFEHPPSESQPHPHLAAVLDILAKTPGYQNYPKTARGAGNGGHLPHPTTSVTNAAMPACVRHVFSTWLQWKAKDAKTHLTLPRPWPVRGWSQRVQLDSATPVAGL